MSTAANVSAARASLPQLSTRVLEGLKKGPTVEVWYAGKRYTTEVDGVQKWDNRHLLHSVHTALIRHFSKRLARELTENDTKRVSIPFSGNATLIVLHWMTIGGGNNLDAPAVDYPKNDRRPLEIIRDLARFLEIEPLAKFVEKDIAALPQVPLPLPAATSGQKPTQTKAARPERICYFCGKPGHISNVCRERKALFVNETHGPTYPMRGLPAVAEKSVTKQTNSKLSNPKQSNENQVKTQQAGPKQADHKQADQKQADQKQADPKQADPKQQEQGKASSTEPSSTREKLIPFRGSIRAKDSAGYYYELSFKNIEMEIDWPVTGGYCKVTGAWVRSWELQP